MIDMYKHGVCTIDGGAATTIDGSYWITTSDNTAFVGIRAVESDFWGTMLIPDIEGMHEPMTETPTISEILKCPLVQDQVNEALPDLDASEDESFIVVNYNGRLYRIKLSVVPNRRG